VGHPVQKICAKEHKEDKEDDDIHISNKYKDS
jgi:hypothetical protein